MKYICDVCGYNCERNEQTDIKRTEKGILYFSCPICKGKMLSEQELKDREEMARLIDEEGEDDNLSPKQDALEDITDEDRILEMKNYIHNLGNDEVWHLIEHMNDAYMRSAYRKLFLKVGGKAPIGEAINI